MTQAGINRRGFIFDLGGAVGRAWLLAHGAQLRAIGTYAATVTQRQPWEFLTSEEAGAFDAISAQIIPTDETPGAREANVVRFTDRYLATALQDAQSLFRDDLKLIADTVAARTPDRGSFAALSDTEQIALLTAFERANPASFNRFRRLTMLGMFSHPTHGGNVNKVGWSLIGFEDRHAWQPPFGYYDRG